MEPESVAVKLENLNGRVGRVELRLNDYAVDREESRTL